MVAEDLPRQPVATERLHQQGPDGAAVLARARLQGDVVARMVVQDRQRVAAPAVVQAYPPLEVHLPQVVGLASLEALHASAPLSRSGAQKPVAPEDAAHRAGRRQRALEALVLEDLADLAASPYRMLATQPKHSALQSRAAARRAAAGPAAALAQTGLAILPIAAKPLVSVCPAYLVAAAQLRKAQIPTQTVRNEL